MKVGESEKRCLTSLCRLAGYTRQAYYGYFQESEREAFRSDLIVSEVMRIRTVQRRIGVRKLYHMMQEFLEGHRLEIGRDRFFDLMRDYSLLVRRRQSKSPRTTFSAFWRESYPNIASGFVPTQANQLWVSDITYVRVGAGFAYLSLVTDAYSRKIVGYALRLDLTARGACTALSAALEANPDRERLIHHSDRGTQYYSRPYMKLLAGAAVRVSMSEKSDPLENAIAERVNGILKQELLEKRFESFDEARRAVDEAVSVYNHLRPHLSIDMLTPAEAHERKGPLHRRWKNYGREKTFASAQAMA
jgi:transposase InsO family protein